MRFAHRRVGWSGVVGLEMRFYKRKICRKEQFLIVNYKLFSIFVPWKSFARRA